MRNPVASVFRFTYYALRFTHLCMGFRAVCNCLCPLCRGDPCDRPWRTLFFLPPFPCFPVSPFLRVCLDAVARGFFADLLERFDRAAQVRDGDRPADYQDHVERLEELLVSNPFLGAADQVVGDPVIA